MVTRSGTNRWSGDLFEHLRNTALNANDFFNNSSGVERPKFSQNVFGGSLGGPVKRNRTFLFGTYQGTRTRQEVVRIRTVLTAQARAGLFRWVPPGGTAVQQFDMVRFDPRGKGIDRQVAALMRDTPEPNNFDIGDGLNYGGFRFNNPLNSGVDNFTVRADHHLRSNVRLFFRLSWLRADYIDVLNNAEAPFPGQLQGAAHVRSWGDSFGVDWTPAGGIVNEFRFGRNGAPRDQLRPARLPGPMLSPNAWTSPLNTQFASSVGAPSHEWTDHFSVIRGHHLLKMGVNMRFTHVSTTSEGDNSILSGIYPNVFFGRNNGNSVPASIGPPAGSIGSADRQRFEQLYNDLLGRMARVRQTFYSDLKQFLPPGTARVRSFRTREYGYFVQDDWKVRHNLTLNLGLRYEFRGVPLEQNSLQGTVDRAAEVHGASRIDDLTIVRSSRWYDGDFNNFAPRVGLAWDPGGNGRMAVRAQYGIFYDRLIDNTIKFIDENTPGLSQMVEVYPNETGSDRRVSDGIPVPVRPATPELRPANARQANLALFHPHLRTGYVQHYSLTLQRELFRNTVVEAGFIGNRGVKLFMTVNPNQLRINEDFLKAFRELQPFRAGGTPAPVANTLVRLFGSANGAITAIGSAALDEGSAVAAADTVDRVSYPRYAAAGLTDFYLRNFPQYNLVALGTNDGRSYYDSLQVSLRRQAGSLKVIGHYTLGRSIDNLPTDGVDLVNRPLDSFNLRLGRALSDADRTHVFNAALIYSLPFGRRHHTAERWLRWLNSAVGGWDMGVLTIWESGAVFGVRSGRRTAGDQETYANFAGDRAIGRVMRRGDGVYWFNPTEIGRFSFPAAGEVGSSGRNAFRGPRNFNTDLSLVKRVPLAEHRAVALRAEFYNLFNNVNFAAPGASLLTPSALGRISSTASGGAGVPVGSTSGGTRIVQMVLRYDF